MGDNAAIPEPGKMFQSGERYEAYVGRWSRLAAPMFLGWLGQSGGLSWLDLGCGSGVVTEAILAMTDPVAVTGVDPSAGMVEHARTHITDPRATFAVGDAQGIPLDDVAVDVVVSGLVLNFVPGPEQPAALTEMVRVVKPGGTVAALRLGLRRRDATDAALLGCGHRPRSDCDRKG